MNTFLPQVVCEIAGSRGGLEQNYRLTPPSKPDLGILNLRDCLQVRCTAGSSVACACPDCAVPDGF